MFFFLCLSVWSEGAGAPHTQAQGRLNTMASLHLLGLNHPPSPNAHGTYARPLSDLNHASSDGHLTGIIPAQPSSRSASPTPATLLHPPWVPPGSSGALRSSASPRARGGARDTFSQTLGGAAFAEQLLQLAQSLSPPQPLPASPLPASPALGASGGSLLLASARSGAGAPAPQPPASPRGLFATTATLTSPSPDPFLLPHQPAPPPALAPLRLHLCPAQALLRALAGAARASSGFLTQPAFEAAVAAWDAAPPAASPSPLPSPSPLLATLFALVAREAQPASRSWHHGHASLDFRLLAAALLPLLALTPPAARLEALWSLYEPSGLSARQLAGAGAAVGAGRVALALAAADAPGAPPQEDAWRVRGSIERHARALAGAAFEDSKVLGGRMGARAFQAWLEMRRVSFF